MDEPTTAFLTAQEVAQRIGRSLDRTYPLLRQGVIPSVRIGGSVRIPKDAFEAWLRQLNAQALAEVTSGAR